VEAILERVRWRSDRRKRGGRNKKHKRQRIPGKRGREVDYEIQRNNRPSIPDAVGLGKKRERKKKKKVDNKKPGGPAESWLLARLQKKEQPAAYHQAFIAGGKKGKGERSFSGKGVMLSQRLRSREKGKEKVRWTLYRKKRGGEGEHTTVHRKILEDPRKEPLPG